MHFCELMGNDGVQKYYGTSPTSVNVRCTCGYVPISDRNIKYLHNVYGNEDKYIDGFFHVLDVRVYAHRCRTAPRRVQVNRADSGS